MLEIEYIDIDTEDKYEIVISNAIKECYKEEGLDINKIYISITLTDNNNIRRINKEYRKVDKSTDVLSFPMFEKDELEELIKSDIEKEEIIGDIIISIPTVKEQAEEYGHSLERELSYMVVHGFFHLMGYDHMEEEEKKAMRIKEEKVLAKLNLIREQI